MSSYFSLLYPSYLSSRKCLWNAWERLWCFGQKTSSDFVFGLLQWIMRSSHHLFHSLEAVYGYICARGLSGNHCVLCALCIPKENRYMFTLSAAYPIIHTLMYVPILLSKYTAQNSLMIFNICRGDKSGIREGRWMNFPPHNSKEWSFSVFVEAVWSVDSWAGQSAEEGDSVTYKDAPDAEKGRSVVDSDPVNGGSALDKGSAHTE